MVGPNWDTLDLAGKSLGEAEPGRMLKDRKHLDYLRVFASRPAIVGRTLGELGLPGENAAVIAHVRRGDTDLLARSDLVLEFGDRVGLVANPSDFAGVAQVFRQFDQGDRRVQLYLHRYRDGARFPARCGQHSSAGDRLDWFWIVGSADRSVDSR
jgi:uncharacterized transporter YbjL